MTTCCDQSSIDRQHRAQSISLPPSMVQDLFSLSARITTSLLSKFGPHAVYLGSEAAAEHYSKAASKEYAPRHISVNCIAPVSELFQTPYIICLYSDSVLRLCSKGHDSLL